MAFWSILQNLVKLYVCSLHRRGVSLWFVVYLPLWGDLFICVNSRIEQPAFSLPVCGLECCVTITAHTNQCNIDFSSCFFLFGMYSKQAILHSSPLVSARGIHISFCCVFWMNGQLLVCRSRSKVRWCGLADISRGPVSWDRCKICRHPVML